MEINELRMLQALPLEVKIMKSKLRIEEWYRHFGGKVYVSFSGGKDSTVLLHIVRSMYPEVVAVYADTGLEYPEIRQFVKNTENVVWVKPKMQFTDVIKTYGYPVISKEQSQKIREAKTTHSEKLRNLRINGRNGNFKISGKWISLIEAPFNISEQCCKVMKKTPFKLYEKQTGNKPFIGTMASESILRQTSWLKTGCNSFEGKMSSKPLSFWLEKDIWEYLKIYNVPYSPIYDMGYDRTGCMFCAYGCHLESYPNRFQRMQTTHPKQYSYCMKDIDKGGLGLAKVLDYINVSYRKDLEAHKDGNGVQYQQYKII